MLFRRFNGSGAAAAGVRSACDWATANRARSVSSRTSIGPCAGIRRGFVAHRTRGKAIASRCSSHTPSGSPLGPAPSPAGPCSRSTMARRPRRPSRAVPPAPIGTIRRFAETTYICDPDDRISRPTLTSALSKDGASNRACIRFGAAPRATSFANGPVIGSSTPRPFFSPTRLGPVVRSGFWNNVGRRRHERLRIQQPL